MPTKLLIIGHRWPEPQASAAGSRMMQLIRTFRDSGSEVTFACSSAKTVRSVELAKLGVTEQIIQLNDPSFDAFVTELDPDIVIYDRYMTEEQYGWRVREVCPRALTVLDTEDLHCLRYGREHALKEEKPFDQTYLFNDRAKREVASIYRCDVTLVISESEMTILKENFKVPEQLLYYLPFLLDTISWASIADGVDFSERQDFMTIGSFLHKPNVDGVLFLKKELWPRIKKRLPTTKLHIYGSYPTQQILQLHNEQEGFLIKGYVEDALDAMFQHRVSLAALRYGAGLKGKVIDAMMAGTPCVMTEIAAEGMFGGYQPCGSIENDVLAFAEAAVELYTDERKWRAAQQAGRACLAKRFDKDLFTDSFLGRVNELLSNLEYHRQQNFTGQMLHHHTLQSTKYMSKWIEEKNKVRTTNSTNNLT